MTRGYQLVAVDLLSVVAGVADVCTTILSRALDRDGIALGPEEVRNVLGLPVRRAVSALSRTGRGVWSDAQRQDRVHDAVVEALHDHYARLGAVRQVDGAGSALAAIRAQGLRVVVVTNMPALVARTILGSLDWYDRGLVDTVVTCEEVDDPRPQAGMIFEAMRRTAVVESRRVVKVGATPADLAEGTIAGCGAVVGLTYGAHARDELRLRPHTHLIDRFGMLVDLLAVAEVADRAPMPPTALAQSRRP